MFVILTFDTFWVCVFEDMFSAPFLLLGLIRLLTHQDGHSPLHYAFLNGRLDIAVLLVEKGADPNIMNNVSNYECIWILRVISTSQGSIS